jgi:hypothetical protein
VFGQKRAAVGDVLLPGGRPGLGWRRYATRRPRRQQKARPTAPSPRRPWSCWPPCFGAFTIAAGVLFPELRDDRRRASYGLGNPQARQFWRHTRAPARQGTRAAPAPSPYGYIVVIEGVEKTAKAFSGNDRSRPRSSQRAGASLLLQHSLLGYLIMNMIKLIAAGIIYFAAWQAFAQEPSPHSGAPHRRLSIWWSGGGPASARTSLYSAVQFGQPKRVVSGMAGNK